MDLQINNDQSSSPANKFMLKRIEKEQSRRKKLSEHHQKDENGKVIEHDEVEETPDQQIINPAQPWDQLDEVVHQSQRPSNLKKKAKLDLLVDASGSHFVVKILMILT